MFFSSFSFSCQKYHTLPSTAFCLCVRTVSEPRSEYQGDGWCAHANHHTVRIPTPRMDDWFQTLRDNLMTSGTVTPLADLPAGFFHALIVSRFDALEPPEQTVLKAGSGGLTVS